MKGGILCGYKDIFVVRNRGKIFQESAFFFFHNCLFVLFVLQTDPVSTLIGVYIHLVTHEKHDPRCLKSQGPEGQESVNTSMFVQEQDKKIYIEVTFCNNNRKVERKQNVKVGSKPTEKWAKVN